MFEHTIITTLEHFAPDIVNPEQLLQPHSGLIIKYQFYNL